MCTSICLSVCLTSEHEVTVYADDAVGFIRVEAKGEMRLKSDCAFAQFAF